MERSQRGLVYYSKEHLSWGLSRECRTLSCAVVSTPSFLPLWTDVDPSCECRWEVALSGTADWILAETSSPSTQLACSFLCGMAPRSPLRTSRNQLPIDHLVKLVSRRLDLKLRKQEESEGLGVCLLNEVCRVCNK